MKTKFYLSLFLLLFALPAMAQSNYYYYYKGQKKYLSLDKSSADIHVKNTLNKTSLKSDFSLKDFALEDDNSLNLSSTSKYAKIEFQKELSETEYFEQLQQIKSRPDVQMVAPNFKGSNGEDIGMSDYLYVKLKKPNDYTTLVSLASQKKVSIIEQNTFMPLWYTLRCTENTTENTMQIANFFFETGLFASAVPDFLTYDDVHCSNDTFFYDSWGLSNTGQNGGTNGLDINICDAWNIAQGQNVVVAVLDHGLEINHPDLSNNIHPLSYDTESNSSPSLVLGSHGVACAGIIGAVKDNNEGIVGVSPKAQLMSISNSLDGTANSRIKRADGINWAVQNGADIISNSWGSGVQYDVIDDAIDNALTKGRSGLGTIIVFSSGNGDGAVSYPANSNENIIAVGAMSPCGERKNLSSCDGENFWGSDYGNELDIMAPGVLVPTTDRQGTNGYNPQNENDPNYSGYNNYYSKFNGTSSAAPHVAGVAALVLSVNPNLTAREVNDIIESTAQKVGNYNYSNNSNRPNGTWNNEMGYGLVDAHAAVKRAQELGQPKIDGIDFICYGSTKALKLTNPQNLSVQWSTSSNVQIVSQNNHSVSIKAKYASSGNGWVRATLSNGVVLQEDFTITNGKASVKIILEPMGTNYVALEMVGANGTNINSLGITNTTWQKLSSGGGCYASFGGSGFSGLAHGSCNNWRVYAKITATTPCGTTTIYKTITPPPPPPPKPCSSYSIAAMGYAAYRIIIGPCDNGGWSRYTSNAESYPLSDGKAQIWVYNHYGDLVLKTNKSDFSLANQPKGIYFVKAHVDDKVLIKKVLR